MPDRFENRAQSLEAPASDGFAITPNDGADLSETSRALYIGTGGAISLVLASGVALSFANVHGGTILPLRVKAIKATGTNASDMIGLI